VVIIVEAYRIRTDIVERLSIERRGLKKRRKKPNVYLVSRESYLAKKPEFSSQNLE